ncbi:hypothetical protein [Candidatus Villigracilis affinis]|uniref:hypothetical protein n=1 Tax=Candidatus Villigracilis affinis TaxID=3140682 RepID=UPI002A1C943B|nr:hypothetical protein [Anaerolineales bacterium]
MRGQAKTPHKRISKDEGKRYEKSTADCVSSWRIDGLCASGYAYPDGNLHNFTANIHTKNGIHPVPASPMPTQPIILMITPDPIQVERWREYQTALEKSLLSHLPPKEVLCEWEILSQVDHKVYVWAVCKSGIESSSTPVVIHLETDGSILSVEVPEPGLSDYPKLFPTDVQEKFTYYRYGRAKEMSDHIDWRWTHIDEPPLIVLSATPTP